MFKKKVFFKTNTSDCNLQLWTETPQTPCKKAISYWKFIEVTHLRKSGRGHGSGVIIILLKLVFSQNSWSCPRAYRGAGHRREPPLDGATDYGKSDSILTVSFESAFIFVFARKSKNASRHVLMGPENNCVHLKHACWFLFIESWSSYH